MKTMLRHVLQLAFALLFVRSRSLNKLIREEYAGGEISVDLGCGEKPRNVFGAKTAFGCDIRESPRENILAVDLGIQRLPFEDNSIDYVTAFDLLEHIPRVAYVDGKRVTPFIFLMNEIHRCLKVGGFFLSHTPTLPLHSTFVDPTHVNYMTVDTLKDYFCEPKCWAKIYGFSGGFDLVDMGWDRENLVSLLKKL